MPALAPYVPPQDGMFATWLDNFATLLTGSPGTYDQSAATALSVQTANDAFQAAYAAAVNPSTRTPATVSAKNSSRVNAQAVVRPIAQQISLDPAITTDLKVGIGVNPRTSTPTPVTTPTTAPALSIISAPPLQHILRFRDETSSPSVKAKPYGVTQLQLYAMTSATVVTDPALIAFNSVQTKSPSLIQWAAGDRGKTAYYTARWQTRTGLLGPWAPIVSYTVAS